MINKLVRAAVSIITIVLIATAPSPADAATEEYQYPNVAVGFYQSYVGGTDFYYSMYAPTETDPYAWSDCDNRCGYFNLHRGITYVPALGEVVKSGTVSYTNSKYQAYWQYGWDGSLAKYNKRIKWNGKWIKLHLSSGSLDIYNSDVPNYTPECTAEYPCGK